MANRERGEVPLEIDGENYTLVMDINAICELEDLFSTADKRVSFMDLIDKAGRGSMTHVRGFFWAALRRHHRGLSLTDVGALIGKAGGLVALNEKLMALSRSMRPDQEDVATKGKGAKARPR